MKPALHLFLLWAIAGFGMLPARSADFDLDLPGAGEAIRTWHADKGLPSEMVTAIIQTRDGFLWIGTSAGLARFDGANFTLIRTPDSPTNRLIGITALCEDRNGSIWIGTQQEGLFQLTGGNLINYAGQKGLVEGAITSLAADTRGEVWIGGVSGLSLWSADHFELFTKRDGLPDAWVTSVNVAHSGTVWITTRLGMCRYVEGHIAPYAFATESQGRSPEYLGAYEDQRGNLWAFGDTYLINLTENKRFNYFRSSESPSVRIWSLCEGRNGRLWIGTSGRGLYCFDEGRFQPVILDEQRWPYDVRAICEDREGNLWLGTSGGGLAQLRPQAVHVLRVEQGLPDGPPTAMALSAAGKVYVALQRGGLFASESGRFERLGGNTALSMESFISSLAVAGDGTLWAGTWGNGLFGWQNGRLLHFTTANGLSDDSVLSVCVDAQGAVWGGAQSGALHRFSDAGVMAFNPGEATVTTMTTAAAGGLWLGTAQGGILREQNGGFTNVTSVGDRSVLALYEGRQQRLWIGTPGGLSCLAGRVVRTWTTNDGLPSPIVNGMVMDNGTNLWLATGAGIYRVDYAGLQDSLRQARTPLVCKLIYPVRSAFDTKNTFGGNRAALAPDGYVWFATTEGLVRITTRQSGVEASVFPVYIESVAVNGEPARSVLRAGPWSPSGARQAPFQAPLNLRSLEIWFTALSYGNPEAVRFRHKLENFDSDWVEDGNNRFAVYRQLRPGTYRFRAEASLAGGPWQQASDVFDFVVPTPFYYQAWAICFYVLVAAGGVAGIVRMISHRRLRRRLARLEQQQSLERERMRIARDMHDEMGSKLTKISFLSEHLQMGEATPAPLAGKIESIAHASRDLLQTMDEIVWVVNPHNDTLENLVAYLSHYAVEYFQNTTIECDMRLPREVPNSPLSSETRHNLFLTFQEVLNNVLKHSNATKVQVEISIHFPACEIRITDNGMGFSEAAKARPGGQTRTGGGGAGQKNMRQRMESIGGRCRVETNSGGGTSVTLRFELPEHPDAET